MSKDPHPTQEVFVPHANAPLCAWLPRPWARQPPPSGMRPSFLMSTLGRSADEPDKQFLLACRAEAPRPQGRPLFRDTQVGPLPINPARSPAFATRELARSLPARRLGGLVTGAAAAAADVAYARFVMEFQVGDQAKADLLAFLIHLPGWCPAKCEVGLVRSGAGSARYVPGHHPRASARPTT
jgi:hypothetical protein